MKVQDIVADVRGRVETAGRNYQDAIKAYFDAQREAVSVVTRNGQTLANTEIGAAKNVFAAARASFDKARTDGVRKVANRPRAYVPNGRAQIVSAYKDTIDLLVRTGDELSNVVSSGYKSVVDTLTGRAAPKRSSASKTAAKRKSASAAGAARKTSAAKAAPAKRKTASKRSAAGKSTTTKSATTARKRTTTAGNSKSVATAKAKTTGKASPSAKTAPAS